MKFNNDYASIPTVVFTKGAGTKRDSRCLTIFALNAIVLSDAFEKFVEERNFLHCKAKYIYAMNA